MEDFIQRLKTEKEELKERLEKLDAFINSSQYLKLNELHRKLLKQQHTVMTELLDILSIRYALLTMEE